MPESSIQPNPTDAVVDATTPLCLICDEESSIRHFLSLILQGTVVDAEEYADGAAIRRAISGKPSDLIFLDVPLDATDTLETIGALSQKSYRGAVQLMSNRGSAVMDRVRSIGEQKKLRMLPPLKKPFDAAAIQKILLELKIGLPPAQAARIRLDEALDARLLEFWYAPKIDLRRKLLAGVDAVPRVRHPQFGMLQPAAFMPGAKPADLLRLAELGIISAIAAERRFASTGVKLPVSLDIDVATLEALPLRDILLAERADVPHWPGLIIDINEVQIATDMALAQSLHAKVAPLNIRLALDNAGRSHAELAKATAMPFAEFKLDAMYVANCGTDKGHAPICHMLIDLAHRHGGRAVGNGITKAADLTALLSMGCDFGQGPLLGQPMPEERFQSLLRQRAASQRAPGNAAA
jgi:EAL domain-containing protein (putative c-di-GMP-specific phosphodiesterase class I)/CheY-like chemotaxis protein